MTKDEALKLAMDWYGSGNQDPDEFEQLISSIVAQPAQDGKCKRCTDGCPACDARKLPEQAPVAWGVFEGNLHDMFFSQEEAQEMADLKGTHAEVRPLYAAPQRTEREQKPMHPEMRKMWEDHFDKCFAESAPQRTWVGLTDEEIRLQWSEFWEAECHPWAIDFAQAIEAKLRSKNNG